ncbi:MAG: CPBP family intramembrane metalloprotease, partial [Clostridia bacterium]|nr:CPBP family intramembrane metalloprotease [Clostridia bacterium]
MRKIFNAKSIYVIFALFVFSLAVTYIDAFVHPPYFSKIPIKILFFLVLPLLYFAFNKEAFGDFKSLFIFRKKGLGMSLLLGVGIYAVIVGGFFLTRGI